jgi:hypothetical protein
MIQVTYISHVSEPLSSEQLLALLLQCRTQNAERGITGMLIYGNCTFLQTIEGDEDVIDPLMEKISKDGRHEDIRLLTRRSIESRQYADWSMGFAQVTDEGLKDVQGLKDFAAEDFTFDYLIGNEPVVNSLMEHFREPNYDQLIGEIYAKDKVIGHLKTALAQVRDRAQLAHLALESLTEAVRKGENTAELLPMCDSVLASLRSH